MPQSNHDRVAELHNHAEHVHDQAAVSKGHGEHLSGQELQREGQEKQREAHARAEALVKGAEKKD